MSHQDTQRKDKHFMSNTPWLDAARKYLGTVEYPGPKSNRLIEDMFDTMYNALGVGLAAPQIGRSIPMFIVDGAPFAETEEGQKPDPKAAGMEDFKKVFINPVITEESGDEWAFNEGCLSIPEVREDVFRKERITIEYQDEDFKKHTDVYDGLIARVIQHEYDHIEGILFTDKLSVLKKTLIKKKLQNIMEGKTRPDYKMKFVAKKGR